MAGQLTKCEDRWLTRFARGRQHPADDRTRVAGQAHAKHQGRQVIEMHSDRRPGGGAGVGVSLGRERQPGERTDGRQHQRADRLTVVQGVGTATAFGSQPADGNAARGQPAEHRRDLAEQDPRLEATLREQIGADGEKQLFRLLDLIAGDDLTAGDRSAIRALRWLDTHDLL
jgi:hypothetical protein